MHSINLRAAWEASDAGSDGQAMRIGLPRDWSTVDWPDGRPPARLRLVRRFGRPAGLSTDALARLRLGGFDGLATLTLNGEAPAVHEEGGFHVVGPFPPLVRNILDIEIDLPLAVPAGEGWGHAAFLDLDVS